LQFTNDKKEKIEEGKVRIDGVQYDPIKFRSIKKIRKKDKWVVSVELREGKNRELRKVFGAFGLAVQKLQRKEFGPYSLGSLPPGVVVQVPLKGSPLKWWQERLSLILDRLKAIRAQQQTTHQPPLPPFPK